MIPRSALDNLFFLLESAQTPMHFGALVQLGAGAEPERIRRLLSHRAARVPTLRLVAAGDGWATQRRLHTSALIEPRRITGDAALRRFIDERMGQPLPSGEPAWHIDIIQNDVDGRVSLLVRMHHALADGVAASRLLASLADPQHRARARPKRPRDSRHGTGARHATTLGEVAAQLDGIATWFAPHTPFNRRVTSQRTLAWQPLSQGKIHEAARRLHASPNDVAVAACAGGLRAYLRGLHALPARSLVAALPISLHLRDGGGQGNRLAGMTCQLGTDLRNSSARLHLIRRQTFRAHRRHLEGRPHALMDLTAWLPATGVRAAAGLLALTPIADRFTPLFNLVITHVPGIADTFTLGGADIEAIYPFTPLFHGIGLTLALFGCGPTLGLGLTGCPATTPHLWQLSRAVREALDELLDAARSAGSGNSDARPGPGC